MLGYRSPLGIITGCQRICLISDPAEQAAAGPASIATYVYADGANVPVAKDEYGYAGSECTFKSARFYGNFAGLSFRLVFLSSPC